MSEQKHDPLCPYWTFYDDCAHSPCQCELIAEVREAVAKKIEAMPAILTDVRLSSLYPVDLQHVVLQSDAVRIARG